MTVLGTVSSTVHTVIHPHGLYHCPHLRLQFSTVGSSVAMEKGLWHFLDKLLTQGVTITSIATDRHTGGAS